MKKHLLILTLMVLTISTYASSGSENKKNNRPHKMTTKKIANTVVATDQLCLTENLVLPCSETGDRLTVKSCCLTSDCTIWDLFDSNDSAVSDYCFWQPWVG